MASNALLLLLQFTHMLTISVTILETNIVNINYYFLLAFVEHKVENECNSNISAE